MIFVIATKDVFTERMNRKHVSIVLFLIAFAIMVRVYVLEYRQSAVSLRSFHEVEESLGRLIGINEISSFLKDIQRSHRGYLIPHRPKIAAPYQHASEMLASMICNLADDFQGHSVSKMLFNCIVLLTEQIETGERTKMEPSRDVQAQPEPVFTILISGLILSLLLFVAALIIIYRSQSKIKKLNHKIDVTNKELHDANDALIYANHKLEETSDALQKVNNELNDFSYSISHDLKAPLRAIRGFCEMLKEDVHEGMDERTVKTINTIEQNAKRMDHLINDLLHLARLGNSPLVKQPVDMKTIIEDVLTEQPLAPNTKISLLPMDGAKADPGLVRQVWENLLSNAAKFSSKNKSPEIEIGCKKDGTEQVYWVKDNGVGFDPAYSDKLFKVFSRLHAKKDFEGTGTGLAIVKKIIDAHGGRIWAEAEVSHGAAFYFTLPTN